MNKQISSNLIDDMRFHIENQLRTTMASYSQQIQRRIEPHLYDLSQQITQLSLNAIAGKDIHADMLHLKAQLMNIGAVENLQMKEITWELLKNFLVTLFTRIITNVVVTFTE